MQFAPDGSVLRGVLVTLTAAAQRAAQIDGTARQDRNRYYGRRDAHGLGDPAQRVYPSPDGAVIHRDGRIAERVVATYLEVPWHPMDPRPDKGRDLLLPLEIRSTRHEGGRLPAYVDDPADCLYVLVIVRAPALTHRLVGWLPASDARLWPRSPTFGDHPHLVPQGALRPPATLRDALDARVRR